MEAFTSIEYEDWPEFPFYLDDIKETDHGLVVSLYSHKSDRLIDLIFEAVVYSYKVTNESYSSAIWIEDPEDYYPLDYASDSKYIDEISNEPMVLENRIYDVRIICSDYVINILSSHLPKIKEGS